MVFTKILRPILHWARSKGIRITAYLNDLLLMASTEAHAQLHTRRVLSKLHKLGFASTTPSRKWYLHKP